MRILIIGATRGIGRQLLTQAIERGVTVSALVRNPNRFRFHHLQLTVFPGDIMDSAAIKRSVSGHDAVCITVGTTPTRKRVRLFSQGTQNVIAAMQSSGVRKLICVTGIGAGNSRNHGGFLYDKLFQPLLLKAIYEDKDRQEEIVRQSSLEWVIARPGFLTNGPLTGRYRVITDLDGVTAGKISRADVAHFILEQVHAMTCLHQTPLLTY